MSELTDRVRSTAEGMEYLADRMVIEDEFGLRYTVTRVYAVGTKTEDPGIVVRIVRQES